jgi:hypothetical protein
MGITITDGSNNPLNNVEVTIYWFSGHSSGRTDSSGYVEFKILGTAERIVANDKEVFSGSVMFPSGTQRKFSI